jgi:hypothetical protein
MNCAEFQQVLPYIIETGGNADEEAHLKSCPVCSDLVQDLKYIAEAAKLLLPMDDPSPRVWDGIRGTLQREGMVRPFAGTARFRPQAEASLRRRWPTTGSMLAAAALLLIAIGVWFRYNSARETATGATASAPAAAPAIAGDPDDAQLLSVLQKKSPTLAASYRENLDTVNAYIRDASRTVEQYPNDMGARDHLIRAYGEKALLYKMALARSEQ